MSHYPIRIKCVCDTCGKEFDKQPCRVRENRGKYCSFACRTIGLTTPIAERFQKHLAKPNENGCILWTGKKNTTTGYGLIRAGGPNRKELFAHRVAYELAYGTFENSLLVCHKCDVRSCCNPTHLFLGTIQDNNTDAKQKERNAKGEKCRRSVLTDNNIRDIRQRYADKISDQPTLAKEFGVSQSTISSIINRTTWKHIT